MGAREDPNLVAEAPTSNSFEESQCSDIFLKIHKILVFFGSIDQKFRFFFLSFQNVKKCLSYSRNLVFRKNFWRQIFKILVTRHSRVRFENMNPNCQCPTIRNFYVNTQVLTKKTKQFWYFFLILSIFIAQNVAVL